MNQRRGFTLVEVLVTMSVGSTLMVLAIGLVHQTLTLSTVARQRDDHLRSLNRLARQFRDDVHHSTACTVTTPDQLQLEMPDESVVTFRAESNRVTRMQPTSDGRTRKATFLLLSNSSTQFAVLDDPNRAVVTVARSTITVPHKDVVDRKTEAVVGRLSIHEQAEVPQ
jgi:prepilin-type N-terminal cleavage/methylation domain-containing protein